MNDSFCLRVEVPKYAEWRAEGSEVGALFIEWYVPVPLPCVDNGEKLSAIELGHHLINCLLTVMFPFDPFVQVSGV